MAARKAGVRAANASVRSRTRPRSASAARSSVSTARSCPIAAEAATPCPTTSPTTSATLPSASGIASNQSPPADCSCPATRYRAAILARGRTGRAGGSSASCTSATICWATSAGLLSLGHYLLGHYLRTPDPALRRGPLPGLMRLGHAVGDVGGDDQEPADRAVGGPPRHHREVGVNLVQAARAFWVRPDLRPPFRSSSPAARSRTPGRACRAAAWRLARGRRPGTARPSRRTGR